MFNIDVKRQLKADINEVFAMLSDHEGYERFRGVDASRLLEPGAPDANGLGALREIVSGKTVLHERIVEYEPPVKLGYKIEYSTPLPYLHDSGLITLTENDEGVLARWQSTGHINILLLGNMFFDKQIDKYGARAFSSILKQVDAHLSAHAS